MSALTNESSRHCILQVVLFSIQGHNSGQDRPTWEFSPRFMSHNTRSHFNLLANLWERSIMFTVYHSKNIRSTPSTTPMSVMLDKKLENKFNHLNDILSHVCFGVQISQIPSAPTSNISTHLCNRNLGEVFCCCCCFTLSTPLSMLPPATPPCRSSTSQPGLFTSNERITETQHIQVSQHGLFTSNERITETQHVQVSQDGLFKSNEQITETNSTNKSCSKACSCQMNESLKHTTHSSHVLSATARPACWR